MQLPWVATLLLLGQSLAQEASESASTRCSFERLVLDQDFYAEGATLGDLNGDGRLDLIAGPWWYEGPDFQERHAYFSPKNFDPSGYSDNFFAFVHDFNADHKNDILVIGFPGEDASWFQNPGPSDAPWIRHRVLEGVDNESPTFTDITGDGIPEIVCQQKGKLGWAGPDPSDASLAWQFHPVSAQDVGSRYTHGLGVGDWNGDGRQDLMMTIGIWVQPENLREDPVWEFHPFSFSQRRGGAQMLPMDVDEDGDLDVITSLDAHGWGLSWFEQITDGPKLDFREHRILDSRPDDNPYGVSFSQMHALCLADVDGDGRQDFITGKRYWAHGPSGDPDSAAAAVVYWFSRTWTEEGVVEFVPHLADDDSGVGVQVVAGDANGDGLTDIVISNKKGTFLLQQRRQTAFEAGVPPVGKDGVSINLNLEWGDLQGWTATGNAFTDQPVSGDSVATRLGSVVSRHEGRFWIGGYEIHGNGRVGTLTSAPFRVIHPWASMLVGGGRSLKTRLELVRAADDAVLFMTPGPNHETMQRVAVDLRTFQGQIIRVRLVDEETGGWGHINYDDFLFHEIKPKFVQERKLPQIIPYKVLQQSGLEAEAAAATMTVPEGFQVRVIAAEPDLHQPIAFTIDARGRLWVAEAYSYPQRRAEGQGLDRILVLEDQDADGEFETHHVFAEGLNLVSGLAVGFGGVWVGAAPHLMFLADQDGDLKADGPPEILLDGWGYQDTHETLNSFTWGPDGWLYGCQGVFTHSRVGKLDTPDEERIPINAGVWRFHPQRHEFEVFAWGTSNPWGVDFDDHGQAFLTACVIPHLFHAIPGGRMQRQAGPHFNPFVFDDLQTIADHRHYTGKVADHAWWGRNSPVDSKGTDAAGGGHAHCGAMIYLGDNFPAEYRNSLFMHNILGNRINRDVLQPQGSGYSASHAPDFLLANDQWYRGVDLQTGPDGGVYFIDWYDRQACHRGDPEVWDRSNGRLYQVTWGQPAPQAVALDTLSNLELVDLQLHPNDWQVRTARRLLQERGGNEETNRSLEMLARSHPDTPRRLRALWALHAVGGIDADLLSIFLGDQDPHLRAWAVRLGLENQTPSPSLMRQLESLAKDDPSPIVRLALASGLQRIPLSQRWSLAARLMAHEEDSRDANIPLLLWYGVEALAELDPARAVNLALEAKVQPLAAYFWRRLAAGETAGLEALCAAMNQTEGGQLESMLAEMDRALDTRPDLSMPVSWPQLASRLLAKPQFRDRAAKLSLAFGDRTVAPFLRSTLEDPQQEIGKRNEALQGLLRVRDAELAPVLHRLLAEKPMRIPALRALAAYDHPDTPERLFFHWKMASLEEQQASLNILTSRSTYARILLRLILNGDFPRSVLEDAGIRRQLTLLDDPQVLQLLQSAWGRVVATPTSIETELKSWMEKLTPSVLSQANLPQGRALFAQNCMPCHTLFGEGGDLGPDLTGSNRADLDYILRNILDPSSEVGREYLMTTVYLQDGRVVSGMVAEENDLSITLRNGNQEVTVSRSQLAQNANGETKISRSSVSIMPARQLQGMTTEQARDLVAYLAIAEQVSLPELRKAPQ